VKEQVAAFLRGKGLRRTSQREAIVEAAFGTNEHFTAEELHAMARKVDPTVSRATVYRTLPLLVESGLLREIDLGRDLKYYDPNFIERPYHNHIICLDCNKVFEFEDDHIEMLEDCILKRLGFTPETKSIKIEASCEKYQTTGRCENMPKSRRQS
jgi:Fur family ferric uptake transcriptional regulator